MSVPDVTRICDKRERNALAQLVVCGERVLKETILKQEQRVIIARALWVGVGGAERRLLARGNVLEGRVLARRSGKLFIEEGLRADTLHVGQQRVVRPERRLLEKTDRVSLHLR